MGWAGTDTPLIRTGTWLRWKRCAHVSRTQACSLGIPTLSPDILEFPGGRIYGPIRLPRLLRGFKLVARIWDGHVLSGNLSQARRDPALYPTRRSIWKNGKLWNGNINQSWCSKKAGRGLATARAVRTVAAKSRRHSPPALFSRHVTGGGAALPVPTHRLVTALLPPRRRCGARHV